MHDLSTMDFRIIMASKSLFKLACFLLLLGNATYIEGKPISCLDDSGKPVDWYVAYKLPHYVPTPVQEGYGYLYLDAETGGFVTSKFSAADTSSAMGATLQQVYNNAKQEAESMAYVFYNDANPEGQEFFDYGHSKGALAFTSDGGFWLVHSVPKYPNRVQDGYSYPHSGTYYGQMFFCVNFNASTFDAIGKQLRFNGPHIHDSQLPSSMAEKFPNMKSLLDGDFILNAPYNMSAKLVSGAGKDFIHFAKNKNFGADLYAAFVAPSLKTDLLAETWQHGSSKTGPSCKTQFTVENIIRLDVKSTTDDYPFVNYKDHSKYVLSKGGDPPFVCIGDINRMESQFERGGGTLCTNDKTLWNVFKGLVQDFISCNQKVVYNEHRWHRLE